MSEPQIWDVAIVGGGVIGLACAFELARRRRRVVVIERDQPGSHASRVAAGLLSTIGLPLGEDDDLFPLKLDSLRRYPQFIAKVESISRMSAGFRTDGTLWVARTAEDDEQLDQLNEKRTSLRLLSRRVTAREVASFEPELAPGAVSGLLVEEDVQVDPRRLLTTLEQGCKTVRANIITSQEVTGGEYDESAQTWNLSLRPRHHRLSSRTPCWPRMSCSPPGPGATRSSMRRQNHQHRSRRPAWDPSKDNCFGCEAWR